jgi:regulatory protein
VSSRTRARTHSHKVAPEQAGDAHAAGIAAVALLARRDFASVELGQKLVSQGFEAAVVQGVIAELGERHYIDDQRFAAHFVGYHAERGQGPARIRRELTTLGLPAELVDGALDGPDWAALARAARIRKFGLPQPKSWLEKARQARFLQYRGFSTDHIRSALGPDFDPET